VLAVHPFQLAQFPVEAQEEVYGDDPNTIVSTSYAPTGQAERVSGGYRVSGRWWFSSACDHGSWVLLGADAPGGDGERANRMVFLLPRSDYRIEDDWYVMGLSGTGSKSIIVDDAFVPEYRTLGWAECCVAAGPGLAVNTGPLFRLPFLAVFAGALVVPSIGAAKGAYQEFCRQSQTRRRGFDRKVVAEDPYLQLRLAQSEADISAAELQVMQDYREMMAIVESGEKIPLESRARYRWHLVNAIDNCARAVERLFAISGGRVIYHDNPIQRFYRDILAARQHTANNHDLGASFMAQATLGLPLPEHLV
ncbi:MAG TPA: acyl-CoA dehydrogenase family protein, partial [Dehalococcoidia bacterium]|nr:acyl-CoA dehydrogenase family protein [Dehalococcoidia bacterium]